MEKDRRNTGTPLGLALLAFLAAFVLGAPPLAAQDLEINKIWLAKAGMVIATDSIPADGKSSFPLSRDMKAPPASFVVIAVGEGSAADKAGLKIGDVVTRGEKGFFALSGKEDIEAEFKVIRAGKPVAVKLAMRNHDLSKTHFIAPAKGDGQTLKVSAFGDARFHTITAALVAARGGDTISVAPGTYRENLFPLSGVRVIASGEAQVASRAPLAAIGVSEIEISGLELAPVAIKDQAGKETFYAGAAVFNADKVHLANIRFTQPSGVALSTLGAKELSVTDGQFVTAGGAQAVSVIGSKLSISGTRFDGFRTAITLSGAADAEIAGNLFEDTAKAIDSSGASRLRARDNIIYGRGPKDSSSAINLKEGRLEASGNTIRGFDRGINLINGDGEITGNTVTGNNHGILVYSGTADIAGNTIFANKGLGLVISHSKKPRNGDEPVTVSGNSILDNGNGISVTNHKKVTITGNLLRGNGDGLRANGSELAFSGNTVVNQHYGLKIGDGSQADIERNIVAYNTFGVTVDARASARLTHNNVYGNLSRDEFPLLDANYVRLDRLPTEQGDFLLVRVFPAYELKGQGDMSLAPEFVQAGEDYRLRASGALAGALGEGERVGAFEIAR